MAQFAPKSVRKSPRNRSSSINLEDINFPNDLLIEILKRVPLKPLIKFTCVSKSWYSLITSPIFISAHGNLNNAFSDHHLFREALDLHSESFCTKFTVSDLQGYSMLNHTEIDCPCPVGKKHFVVCCYDGLVCIFDFYSRNPRNAPLVLWNPSIGKAVRVPAPVDGVLELTSGGFPKLVFGAGFDPVSNDYVVVRIAYFSGGGSRGGDLGSTLLMVHVYGLSLEKWRRLEDVSVSCNFSTIRWRGVCLNGVIHWVGNLNVSSDCEGHVCRSILTFKLGTGVFRVMNLPKELVGETYQTVRIVSVPNGGKDALGVVQNVGNVLSLWMMKEYGSFESWVKLFDVDLGSRLSSDMNVGILSNKVVMVEMLEGSLNSWTSYNHDSKEIKKMLTFTWKMDYVDRYVESLILLGHRNGVLLSTQLRRGSSNATSSSSLGDSSTGRRALGRKRARMSVRVWRKNA